VRGVSISIVVVVGAATGVIAQTNTLDRDRDPVVIVGGNLSSLAGLAIDQVVAFKYQSGWAQIPVQIDERKVVDYRDVYDGVVGAGLTTLAYADPNTYCGADTDPTFDSDDELVFMAKDAGDRAAPGAGEPAGTVAGSGVELAITDALDGGAGYVYLFQTDGTLSPDAGQDYVSYTFHLLAGEYIPDYDTSNGPNPEDSEAFSAYYRTHFSDRWIRDEVNVYAGAASGVDVLDRHKDLFYPGVCNRSEDTFSNAEGAFFVNKDGPVRALRSYMGANSGPLTQRVHRFYERRHDSATHLRVHAIPGMVDFYDYSPAATGMTYYNDLNTSGVTVDGVPDTVTAGEIQWEMVTGAQGALLISHRLETDISPFGYTLFYSDDSSPSYTQCTGDAFEYASSGAWIAQAIPNTDPAGSPPIYYLTHTRVIGYEAPGQAVADAALHHNQANTPLAVAVQSYQPTVSLTLTVVKAPSSSVDLDPEPNDANLPVYPVGTVVTLTAEPNEGKSFKKWTVFDPNFPGDANHATQDTNTILHLTMDADQHVKAVFKCGGGTMPPLGMALLLLTLEALRRRR